VELIDLAACSAAAFDAAGTMMITRQFHIMPP
jgi:hypothetical protein